MSINFRLLSFTPLATSAPGLLRIPISLVSRSSVGMVLRFALDRKVPTVAWLLPRQSIPEGTLLGVLTALADILSHGFVGRCGVLADLLECYNPHEAERPTVGFQSQVFKSTLFTLREHLISGYGATEIRPSRPSEQIAGFVTSTRLYNGSHVMEISAFSVPEHSSQAISVTSTCSSLWESRYRLVDPADSLATSSLAFKSGQLSIADFGDNAETQEV
ncbi:hypothetical protein EXIGLDRAFT_747563 [Exidia glandulosa HHB12029]|uniref:Uncharacterized protein n=1 Tax=Exidia glandulosa HHB12029 TaxID=1314781 RepID=A0A165KPZ1_EXIGL|nr:hypothetical protein EXIGLDRAFT_747563 [Exidia glandulosa HHB12029]